MARIPMNRPTGTTGGWNYSEYARLPDDGNRYEVLDDEVLVTPGPTPHHQKIVQRLLVRLLAHFEGSGIGIVLQDVDLLFAPGQFLRPDLVVVRDEDRTGITERGVEVPPWLVAEILSPSSRTIDFVKKPYRHLEFGVPAYWVVDPPEATLWVWDRRSGADAPRRETGTFTWKLDDGTPPFELDVAALVAPL